MVSACRVLSFARLLELLVFSLSYLAVSTPPGLLLPSSFCAAARIVLAIKRDWTSCIRMQASFLKPFEDIQVISGLHYLLYCLISLSRYQSNKEEGRGEKRKEKKIIKKKKNLRGQSTPPTQLIPINALTHNGPLLATLELLFCFYFCLYAPYKGGIHWVPEPLIWW